MAKDNKSLEWSGEVLEAMYGLYCQKKKHKW
jgi:hypothetical protein